VAVNCQQPSGCGGTDTLGAKLCSSAQIVAAETTCAYPSLISRPPIKPGRTTEVLMRLFATSHDISTRSAAFGAN